MTSVSMATELDFQFTQSPSGSFVLMYDIKHRHLRLRNIIPHNSHYLAYIIKYIVNNSLSPETYTLIFTLI